MLSHTQSLHVWNEHDSKYQQEFFVVHGIFTSNFPLHLHFGISISSGRAIKTSTTFQSINQAFCDDEQENKLDAILNITCIERENTLESNFNISKENLLHHFYTETEFIIKYKHLKQYLLLLIFFSMG